MECDVKSASLRVALLRYEDKASLAPLLVTKSNIVRVDTDEFFLIELYPLSTASCWFIEVIKVVSITKIDVDLLQGWKHVAWPVVMIDFGRLVMQVLDSKLLINHILRNLPIGRCFVVKLAREDVDRVVN